MSAAEAATGETLVTPWEVRGGQDGIDYDKVLDNFGCQKVSPELIARFERCTGHKAHPMLRRGLFYAHRDLERICEAKEKGIPMYLYTGRGPASESIHIGHLIPFIINRYLQQALDCPMIIQLTDDEKYLFKEDLSLEQTRAMAYENAKDILAVGFDPDKTFIFSDIDYYGHLYPTVLKIAKRVTFNQAKGIFGFNNSTNIGMINYPAAQAAPAFACSLPTVLGDPDLTKCARCLIACAIDQDPYFRMSRDLAPRLGLEKPCLLLSKFIPSLQGSNSKMSGSRAETAIYVSDSPQLVKKKINKYAFSGGRDTAEEQRQFGANLEVDVAFQYLTYFLDDDEELAAIAQKYSSGQMLTGEVKQKLIVILQDIFKQHQERRAQITQEVLQAVMSPERPLIRTTFEKACAQFRSDTIAAASKST